MSRTPVPVYPKTYKSENQNSPQVKNKEPCPTLYQSLTPQHSPFQIDSNEFYDRKSTYQRKRSISYLNETLTENYNPLKDEVNNFLKESTAIQQQLASGRIVDTDLDNLNSTLANYGFPLIDFNKSQKEVCSSIQYVVFELEKFYEIFRILNNLEADQENLSNQLFQSVFNRKGNWESYKDQGFLKLISWIGKRSDNSDRKVQELTNIIKYQDQELNSMKIQLQQMQEPLEFTCQSTGFFKETPINIKQQRIIEDLQSILLLKNDDEILPKVEKMKSVFQAVPKLESFIKEVTLLVFPQLAYEDNPQICTRYMKEVIPKLKQNMGTRQNDLSRYGEFGLHYKNLFNIQNEQQIIQHMDQLFIQWIEIKNFMEQINRNSEIHQYKSFSGKLYYIQRKLCN